MLTDSAYLSALIVYSLSAMLAVALMNYWLLRKRSLAVKMMVSLPVLSLLLTPALIQPEADTFAPALVVLAFQWLSQGQEAAEHALRPLLMFTAIATAIGACLALLVGVLSRRQNPSDSEA
ncbi:hypothetical protein R0137_10710 [Congregibacter brevis]|uniref:CidA/LrgA family protein n=1 Tax=Congregibacter brevis TaxID=3081201 RepID=A0ABZ0IBD5_9GAMM|nr:hypothetical protein R0137_10710 [Congregibacter sp. IMCC45268]